MKKVLESNLAHWHGATRGEGDEDTAHEGLFYLPSNYMQFCVSKLELMFMLLVLSLLLPTFVGFFIT